MKRLLTQIFNRLARAVGIPDIYSRLERLENTQNIPPDLYIRLEKAFRGDPALIAQRQSQYIPHVQSIVSSQHPLLDLGCGRGEWLTVLSQNGLPARGIDGNSEAVAMCQERGLHVEFATIEDVLKSTKPGSLGAITLFQVLEHVDFQTALSILTKARSLLIPNGVLIAEIPNLETLRVGAGTFWIDPTHVRPLFPAVLRFLADEAGFSDVATLYSTPLELPPDLGTLEPQLQDFLLRLHQQINGNGDFAIIARN